MELGASVLVPGDGRSTKGIDQGEAEAEIALLTAAGD